MSSDFPDVPEPFRYSRAHSWPQAPGGGGSASPPPPPPPKLQPPRGPLIMLAAVAAALGLIVSAVVAKVVLNDDEVIAAPSQVTPTVIASTVPEPSERAVPQSGLPRPTAVRSSPSTSPSSPAPTASAPRPGPPPANGPLASYLLTAADVKNFAPGTWDVNFNSVTTPIARHEKLVSCSGDGRLTPHLDRQFKLPTGRGKFDVDGPRIIQRIVRYGSGGGARAVQGYRDVVASCPTRRTEGYTERWTVVQDTKTSTGDVLIIRRLPEPTVPQDKVDFGNDYIVVRNGDVVLLVDFRARSNVRLDLAQTRTLASDMTARLCGGSAC